MPTSTTPCAGRDADSDGLSACYDCDDFDPNVQDCPPPEDPCDPIWLCQ